MARAIVSVSRLAAPLYLCGIAVMLLCLGSFGCKSMDSYYDIDPTVESGLSGWGGAHRWSDSSTKPAAATNQRMDISRGSAFE